MLILAISGAGSLAIIGSQRGNPAPAADFAGAGIEGYALTGAIGAPLIPTVPVDVLVEESGRTYVADIGINRVLAFGPDGQLDQTWGDGGMSAHLDFPTGLALGPDGALYVLQLGRSEIHVLDRDGNERDAWAVGGNQNLTRLGVPVGIAVDAKGIVYVPDQRSQQIRRYQSDGEELDGWQLPLGAINDDQIWPHDIIEHDGQIVLSYSDSSGSQGGLVQYDADGNARPLPRPVADPGSRAPGAIAADPDGEIMTLYISLETEIPPLVVARAGAWETSGIDTLAPINGLVVPGIDIDANGRLFVADPGDQRVRIYNPNGSVAGDIQSPDDAGKLAGLDEIVVTADGLIYAADPLLGRVVAFRPDGSVETVFELPEDPDQPFTTGFTRQRMRIAVDSVGSVYAVDEFTGRITKFRQDGAVMETDWLNSASEEQPIVAMMLAAGEDERIFMVGLGSENGIRAFSGAGEDLGDLIAETGGSSPDEAWDGAIQDIVVSGDTLYTVELGIGSSTVRRLTADGGSVDALVDLSSGDGNGNRTGFALAVEPDGSLLIGAVNVKTGPTFEYQLLRLDRDGNLRRIGSLPTPFTTQPDIAVSPTGTLYIAAPNDQQIYVYEPTD